jgi:preprotein translocase subunit SecA
MTFIERSGDELPIDHPLTLWRPMASLLGRSWRAKHAARLAQAAAALDGTFRPLGEDAFRNRRVDLVKLLRRRRLDDDVVMHALALVREACRRELSVQPYVEQMTGGAALLFGHAVEMATGEGKTITATFPAAIHALSGRIVHVVTSNDYLTERDHNELAGLYRSLGLTVGLVVHGKTPDERRAAYGADITYVSNKEVAFDYLRDRLVVQASVGDPSVGRRFQRAIGDGGATTLPVQRGLDVAIVDEIDSVLIDEAGTPLLISQTAGEAIGEQAAREAMAIVDDLQDQVHYSKAVHGITVELTDAGRVAVDDAAKSLQGVWRQRIRRDGLASAALVARHGLQRDRHYIVRDGKIVIIDEHTGRTMPDRAWEQDIHTMVEFKESCPLSHSRRSLASISFQRFFRRYRTLSGMSGTVSEVAAELARVYRLPLTRVARRLPLRLTNRGQQLFGSRNELWAAVCEDVKRLRMKGQPVLIGVCTVDDARRASAALENHGIAHRVLSADQDRDEALAVAQAGQRGAITVATSMAGRGTDIRLGEGVSQLGGLVVLLCERHGSRRVDRQLIGRCARQGDPGGFAEYLSAEDVVLTALSAPWLRLAKAAKPYSVAAFWMAQQKINRVTAKQRFDLVRRDESLSRTLAFAGGLD